MSTIVELDERGAIRLPDDVVASLQPRTRFVIERQGVTLILHPVEQSFEASASSAERVAAVREWASLDRPAASALTDEALSREQMYDLCRAMSSRTCRISDDHNGAIGDALGVCSVAP